MFATDRELPAPETGGKRERVRGMFAAIAPRYDLLNHVLSLNIDRVWRRRAVAQLGWERVPEGTYLDICSGTMDLAAALGGLPGFAGRVIGADFVHEMLVRGRLKSPRIVALAADALDLPFSDRRFDGATVGFGVRNLVDLDQGLREAARVLKPGAKLVILEFTIPPRRPLRTAYLAYFTRVLPAIGRLVSKHRTAYTYLPESVLSFPSPEELAQRMRDTGFEGVEYCAMTGGICAWHVGTRI
ncbi:MAG: class I SAM-dependent methyltransferase [Gemmatimonadales bacterium]|nr:MAG: class I SAM-dependent methyltransferase [Gemmatimonadales bacterium]